MESKVCTRCKLDLALSSFHRRKEGNYHSWCKPCFNDYNKIKNKQRRDSFPTDFVDTLSFKVCCKCKETKDILMFSLDRSNKDGRHRRCRECDSAFRPSRLLSSAKSRAMKSNLDFNLELIDIIIPEFCPILGIKLNKNRIKFGPDSPSLDRVDTTKGYIKGNVKVISHRANTMKSDMTKEQIRKLYEYVCG